MKSRTWSVGLGFLFVASLAFPALAATSGADIAASGTSAGAPPCSACHESDGRGRSEGAIPRLAGLPAGYILEQLDAFATDARKNDTMTPVANALTPDERQAVADFYAKQVAPPAATGETPEAAMLKDGAQLFQTGAWDKGIPPCGQCHGFDGRGVGKAFPPLAGQLPDYVLNQLQAWRAGARTTDPLHLMTVVASRLDDKQIKSLAAYVHSLPPGDGTGSQGVGR